MGFLASGKRQMQKKTKKQKNLGKTYRMVDGIHAVESDSFKLSPVG